MHSIQHHRVVDSKSKHTPYSTKTKTKWDATDDSTNKSFPKERSHIAISLQHTTYTEWSTHSAHNSEWKKRASLCTFEFFKHIYFGILERKQKQCARYICNSQAQEQAFTQIERAYREHTFRHPYINNIYEQINLYRIYECAVEQRWWVIRLHFI